MKRHSPKRAAIEAEYRRALQIRLEQWDSLSCEGCGKNVPCTPSHLIPRSFDRTLISDPSNFHFHCEKCSVLCEAGEYDKMLDGDDIVEYIGQARPDYLEIKKLAYYNRYKKEMEL